MREALLFRNPFSQDRTRYVLLRKNRFRGIWKDLYPGYELIEDQREAFKLLRYAFKNPYLTQGCDRLAEFIESQRPTQRVAGMSPEDLFEHLDREGMRYLEVIKKYRPPIVAPKIEPRAIHQDERASQQKLYDFAVQWLDELGNPLSDIKVMMRYDGRVQELTTDGSGFARVRQTPAPTAVARPKDIAALRKALRPRWAEPGGMSDWLTAEKDGVVVTRLVRDDEPLEFRLKPEDVEVKVVSVQPFAERTPLIGGFELDSSFPEPGMLYLLSSAAEVAEKRKDAKAVILGHTDQSGTLAHNKKLSDQRAKAVLALLTQNLAMFDEIAKADDWGTMHYQSMLRGVGCNPGPIDGIWGELTEAAVETFQEEYNEGVFHRAEGCPPRAHGALTVDGILGKKTKAALRDAYVAQAPKLDAGRFAGPRFVGCSELNPLEGAPGKSRRVELALIEDGRPHPDDFPCKEGDVGACRTDRKSGVRCKFYRQHFTEFGEDLEHKPFFDFQWLEEDKKKYSLSALTTLPDNTPAKFTIYRWEGELPDEMPNSATTGGSPPAPGKVVGTATGTIRGGVAYARWNGTEDFDPFDVFDWFVDHDAGLEPGEDSASAEELDALESTAPPVFLIEAAGEWGFSVPPSRRLNRVRVKDHPEGEGVAVAWDGGIVPWKSKGGGLAPDGDAPEDVGVTAVAMQDHEIDPAENEPSAVA